MIGALSKADSKTRFFLFSWTSVTMAKDAYLFGLGQRFSLAGCFMDIDDVCQQFQQTNRQIQIFRVEGQTLADEGQK